MIDKPIIKTITEYRQVGRVIEFPADLARHVNWDAINQTRDELGSDLHVTLQENGSLTFVFSWHYSEDEARKFATIPDLRGALQRLTERVEQIELPDGSTPDTLEARMVLEQTEIR